MDSGNWAWDRYWHFDRVASCCDEGGRANYDTRIADGWRDFFESLPPNSRILDLCTGNGAVPLIALEVSESQGKQFALTGIDRAAIDPAQFAVSRRERLAQIAFRGEVEVEQLPFDDSSFDAVTSQYGIEYSDLGRSLGEAVRVLSPGGRLRFCMHAAEGSVAASTRLSVADADFLLDEVELPARSEEAFKAVFAVERTATPTDEETAAGDRAFARFGECLAAVIDRIPQAADQQMLHSSGSVIAHAFENRAHFTLDVLLAKVKEVGSEIEAHRIRERALLAAAVDRARVDEIAGQLQELGLADVETEEVRPAPDQFLGYVVSGQLPR